MKDVEEAEMAQRELLHFDVSQALDGLNPDYANCVLHIKEVAEKVLFHWKNLPVVLPQPFVMNHDEKSVNLRDIFLQPSFDEVDAVAFDAKGEPLMLTAKQLTNIREYGEFEVESLNFPGHFHQWSLSPFLQAGFYKINQSFLNDISAALRCIYVIGFRRISSPFFSLSESWRAALRGFSQLIDALVGMPTFRDVNLATKLKEERSKYLVAELIVPHHLEEELEFLCLFIMQQIHKQKIEKYKLDLKTLPPVPYFYQTPKGFNVDLRLFNKDLMKKLLPHLARHLEKEARGWFTQFKEIVLTELKSQKLSDAEMELKANASVMDEYLRRIYEAVLRDSEIANLGLGLGELLVEQAKATILMHRAIENVQVQWNSRRIQLEADLRASHPIRSRIDPWLREQLDKAEVEFMLEHRWLAQETALQACVDAKLNQAAMFLHRDLVFMREREAILLKELSRVKTPRRIFYWRVPIWFTKNWVVRKVHRGRSEVIPTKLISAGTANSCRIDPNEPVFLIEKQLTSSTSTSWLFWRWRNFGYRMWAWLWNAMFIFGVVVPWSSSFSFRALFSFSPFVTDLEAGHDGTLLPRRTSATRTFCSRLISLWRHISKSRTEFESSMDAGFIGKGFSRHLNRFWNYVVKGVLGSVLLALGFPATCVLLSALSLGVALCAPLWIPAATLLFHLFCILFYDLDAADERQNRWCVLSEAIVWNILVRAFVQPLFAFAVASVFCPLASLFVILFAVTRRALRLFWDASMFHIIIKRRGRIPAADSVFVKRIAGPGMSSQFYYQIVPEQALAAFEARLQLDELRAYQDQVERAIQKPQLVFSDFVKSCFGPFSGHLIRDGQYLFLEKEATELRSFLADKLERYKQSVMLNVEVSVLSKVKMSASDLNITTKLVVGMLENFYPSRVISRLDSEEEEFWENRGLAFNDWFGLSAQIFSEMFSPEILVPLNETDVRYKLGVQNVNLSKFTQMMAAAENGNGISSDKVEVFHSPKANVQVHAPYLNVAVFSPVSKREVTVLGKRNPTPWRSLRKPGALDKMRIPLPLPTHPVHIAVVIYNREAEEPIPLEEDACQTVLRAIEDYSAAGTSRAAAAVSSTAFVDVDLASVDSAAGMTAGRQGSLAVEEDDEDEDEEEDCSEDYRRNSAAVNLASSEDITLEPDGERVIYSHSSYSTMV